MVYRSARAGEAWNPARATICKPVAQSSASCCPGDQPARSIVIRTAADPVRAGARWQRLPLPAQTDVAGRHQSIDCGVHGGHHHTPVRVSTGSNGQYPRGLAGTDRSPRCAGGQQRPYDSLRIHRGSHTGLVPRFNGRAAPSRWFGAQRTGSPPEPVSKLVAERRTHRPWRTGIGPQRAVRACGIARVKQVVGLDPRP